MLYELRTYTVKPGSLGDMVKAASSLARDIRKDNYGKLEGYWLTEIGTLNQVVHLLVAGLGRMDNGDWITNG
jgi:NIPSNAP